MNGTHAQIKRNSMTEEYFKLEIFTDFGIFCFQGRLKCCLMLETRRVACDSLLNDKFLKNTLIFLISRSPVQDVMSTPHFQLKRLRKELAHEGDVRDELEKELANQISIISEKGTKDLPIHHHVSFNFIMLPGVNET